MAESAEVLALPAEGGAAPLGPQPGEVWSLWDMLEHFARDLLEIGEEISDIQLQILDSTISFFETLATRLSEDALVIAPEQSAP